MFVVYRLLLLILAASTVLSHAGTVINVYASDQACGRDGSVKNSVDCAIVAFSVGRKAALSPSKKTIISMDHEFYNDGGYFDMKTSVFTAPVSGVYAFSFGACGQPGKPTHIMLFVGYQDNAEYIASTYNHNKASYNQVFGSVYKKMKKGEQASVWTSPGHGINYSVPPSTYFSGHLIN